MTAEARRPAVERTGLDEDLNESPTTDSCVLTGDPELDSPPATPACDGSSSFHIEVFYDGDCPLCSREIEFLRKRDRRNRIRFTDLTSPEFDPERETGRTSKELMDRIHGRLDDGRIIEGVEVFRRLYTAIGWGFLVAPTRWPVVRQFLDFGYRLFARYRLALTGRRCQDGVCGVER